MLPTPGPAVVGHDVLRDEPIIDEEATHHLRALVDEINMRGRPVISKEEHWRRQLEYLRRFAPEQYQDYVDQHPEEFSAKAQTAEKEALPELAKAEAAPVAEAVPEAPAPAADPVELDALLEQEAAAEQAEDAERLAEIRQQIDTVLK